MIRIGLIGLGTIAHRIAKGIEYSENANLYAVVSRDERKASQFKVEHPFEKHYLTLEELLKDSLVDLVYIATPNPLHKKHITLSLQARKHVLCEKPMLMNQKDLSYCFDLARENGVFLMEAQKTVFTPLNQKILEIINDGTIGKVHLIEAQNANDLLLSKREVSPWHFEKDGGGCLYDIGVYPISYCNLMATSNLDNVSIMYQGEQFIKHVQANLLYENGVMAHIASSWICPMENRAIIYGEKARIVCKNYWKNTEAVLIENGIETKIQVSMKSDFTPEIDHACKCIKQGKLESSIFGYHQSSEVLKVIDKAMEGM